MRFEKFQEFLKKRNVLEQTLNSPQMAYERARTSFNNWFNGLSEEQQKKFKEILGNEGLTEKDIIDQVKKGEGVFGKLNSKINN